jgi:glyoxylase-like metal-dependent hydrolase (beta-lactamase superfamily II)
MDKTWEVYALKYGEITERIRAQNFIFNDDHAAPYPIDFFVWVLKSDDQVIVVDTGYEEQEAARRGRPILRDPGEAVKALGIDPETVRDVIITHLHFDHAGGIDRFPNARFHLQTAEMAFATGPCMCMDALQMPFTAEHICNMVRQVFAGRVQYHEGTGLVAPGVSVHLAGGHSRGLQAVQVKTQSGWLCLASDVAHFYENYLNRAPFPIVVDVEDMYRGWDLIETLASDPKLIVPGHDPLVTELFPVHDQAPFIWRLDLGPSKEFE